MTWTLFRDIHSGGGIKEPPYEYIYIELPEGEAIEAFMDRFGHHPHTVSCMCCSKNYSIYEKDSFTQITAYHRGANYDKENSRYFEKPPDGSQKGYQTVEEYVENDDVLVLCEEDL